MKMTDETRREILRNYTDAAREIELAGVAIDIIEKMRSRESLVAIRALMRAQQRHLKKLDNAAIKLGAPYPTLRQL